MERMIERIISPQLSRLASTYKVLTLLGSRQAGKSTLAEPVNGVRYINYADIAPFFTEREKYIPSF